MTLTVAETVNPERKSNWTQLPSKGTASGDMMGEMLRTVP
jgi:hypothetical protein